MPACKASKETRDLLVRRVQTVLMEKKEKWFDFFLVGFERCSNAADVF